ncbi:MAG: tetratricopeptide repeat protein [Candidatus Cloacimonetes bacterium]|nr:tetratricopeptide repeat protein [Candidatus Cloacimonadota bacterium]MBL7085670.1 tetratricopeptide repeat protein [Candidatus Cloacimonadota bacterium]
MRKAILFIILLLIFSMLSAEYDLSDANNAYQNLNYEKAKDIYESLINKGVKSFVLFYNLGNTYFKLKNFGLARLYYEKAAKYKPLDKDLLLNISLLKSKLKDKEESKEPFLINVFHNIFYFFSINIQCIFVLVFFILIMLTVAGLVLARRISVKKLLKLLLIIFSFCFMIFLIVTIARLSIFYNNNSAVIISETVFAYSGPSEDFPQVFTIHEGLKICIEKFDKDWVLIKLQSGNGGWVEKESLSVI